VSWPLEEAFHPSAAKIAEACLGLVGWDGTTVPALTGVDAGFIGPY
jgi:pyruvate dehydrogenase E1 component beta subunit